MKAQQFTLVSCWSLFNGFIEVRDVDSLMFFHFSGWKSDVEVAFHKRVALALSQKRLGSGWVFFDIIHKKRNGIIVVYFIYDTRKGFIHKLVHR